MTNETANKPNEFKPNLRPIAKNKGVVVKKWLPNNTESDTAVAQRIFNANADCYQYLINNIPEIGVITLCQELPFVNFKTNEFNSRLPTLSIETKDSYKLFANTIYRKDY